MMIKGGYLSSRAAKFRTQMCRAKVPYLGGMWRYCGKPVAGGSDNRCTDHLPQPTDVELAERAHEKRMAEHQAPAPALQGSLEDEEQRLRESLRSALGRIGNATSLLEGWLKAPSGIPPAYGELRRAAFDVEVATALLVQVRSWRGKPP